jgi:hypothetical protein
MGEVRIVTDRQEWRACLAEIGAYDFYHTFDYHVTDPVAREGKPVLLYFSTEGGAIAVPLVIRRVPDAGERAIYDAISAYGYPGPLCSLKTLAAPVVSSFQNGLQSALGELGVISVFSRCHPLIGATKVTQGLGHLEPCGRTVAIDLEAPEEAQVQAYSSNIRRGIRKLAKADVSCEISDSTADLYRFVEMYTQSMQRVGATAGYFFDKSYFERIVAAADFDMQLFICRLGTRPICGGLFSSVNGIIQYHLGGSDSEHLALAPTKLMFDRVRHWGSETGHRYLHLGGGVGGQKDGLYRFKSQFSNQDFPFFVWKWIVEPDTYSRLVAVATGSETTEPISYEGYFPAYRAGR